jgi:exonuclease VII small subunit
MSGAEDLDDLIVRLERAAEQLRSGEVSLDAAATLVEDCAALAGRAAAELERRTREEDAGAPSGQQPPPGQDSLLQ